MRLFADDACLRYQFSDPFCVNSVINEELRKVDVWLRANNFLLTIFKLNSCFFKNTSIKCNFKVNKNEFNIEHSKSIKYLGVVLDYKLKWRAHLRSLILKLSPSCFVLSKLRYNLDVSTFKIVYYSLFYPYIQYCISAWGE